MDFYQLFILSCFKKDKPMRTSTLYHLLKGKRTSSILTYGYFYDVLIYFSLLPKLKEASYKKIIELLKEKELLTEVDNGLVILSELGVSLFKNNEFPITSFLQPLSYYKWDWAYFERIVFTTQVLSEKAYTEKHYLPIENNLFKQRRLKLWLSKQQSDVVDSFYFEWSNLIENVPQAAQELILKQLVGHNHRGHTLEQISEEKQKHYLFIYLEFKNYWHQLISLIIANPDTYPLFYSILKEEQAIVKEDSSLLSAELFAKGDSLETISKKRNLKNSTVTDHLIESYLFKPTKIELIDKEAEPALRNFYQKNPDYLMWTFKEAVTYYTDLSFYDFRFFQFALFEKEKKHA